MPVRIYWLKANAVFGEGKQNVEVRHPNFKDTLGGDINAVMPLPNLQISSFVIIPDPIVRGDQATAKITIHNDGEANSTPFTVNWSPNAQAQDKQYFQVFLA